MEPHIAPCVPELSSLWCGRCLHPIGARQWSSGGSCRARVRIVGAGSGHLYSERPQRDRRAASGWLLAGYSSWVRMGGEPGGESVVQARTIPIVFDQDSVSVRSTVRATMGESPSLPPPSPYVRRTTALRSERVRDPPSRNHRKDIGAHPHHGQQKTTDPTRMRFGGYPVDRAQPKMSILFRLLPAMDGRRRPLRIQDSSPRIRSFVVALS